MPARDGVRATNVSTEKHRHYSASAVLSFSNNYTLLHIGEFAMVEYWKVSSPNINGVGASLPTLLIQQSGSFVSGGYTGVIGGGNNSARGTTGDGLAIQAATSTPSRLSDRTSTAKRSLSRFRLLQWAFLSPAGALILSPSRRIVSLVSPRRHALAPLASQSNKLSLAIESEIEPFPFAQTLR